MTRTPLIFIFCLCCARIAGSFTPGEQLAPLVVPVQGAPFAAHFLGFGKNGSFRFRDDEQTTELVATLLTVWGQHADRWSPFTVILRDQSWLNAEAVNISTQEINIETRSLGEVSLPRNAVLAALYSPSADPFERDDLIARIQSDKSAHDRLWLQNGDVLSGSLLGPITRQPTKKQADELDERKLMLRLVDSGRSLAVPEHRVQAAIFAEAKPVDQKAATPTAIFGLRDGSLLRAYKLDLAGDRLELTCCAGLNLNFREEEFAKQVDLLQPLHENVRYLTDIKPLGYKHVPFLSRTWPYGVDRCVAGSLLRQGRQIIVKGVGMHSTSRLAYELAGKYRRFAASVAIDERAGSQGSVIFRLFVDRGQAKSNGEVWESVWESPIIRGGDLPNSMEVEMTGVQRLALVVDFADRGHVCDYANWLNARLIP